MKNKAVFFLATVLILTVPSFVNAEETVKDKLDKVRIEKIDDKIGKIREKLEDRKNHQEDKIDVEVTSDDKNQVRNEGKSEEKKDILMKIKEKVSNLGARISNGTVTEINGTTFIVKTDDSSITVTTDETTNCQRHYWGDCKLSEISINDKVNIWGTYTDESNTTLKAKLIRDTSIMKRHGTFVGDVVSIDGNTFVLKARERGEQKVTVTTTTKYVMRNMKPSTLADIKAGHRLQVKGIWDKKNNTIADVTMIKNFSLPVKGTSTTSGVSPSVTETPTVTP